MKHFLSVAVVVGMAARLLAQTPETPAASTPATSADVEALREEVRTLKELVQTLQQQVKAQQATTEKSDSPALPETPEAEVAQSTSSPGPLASAPPLFPVTDTAVVASAPSVNANGATTTFPTADDSVTTTPAAVSNSDTGSSLTQPLPILGGGNNKN